MQGRLGTGWQAGLVRRILWRDKGEYETQMTMWYDQDEKIRVKAINVNFINLSYTLLVKREYCLKHLTLQERGWGELNE